VRTICRLLGVSPSGYYAWNRRCRSKRAETDELLLVAIREIHRRSQGTYGVPRIHAELAAAGKPVGRKRVARLMREAGLSGVSRRRRFNTTLRHPGRHPAPDLVARNFTAQQGNQLWVADITYIPTAAGFLYLSVVLDVWSRRIVGWSMETHLRTELVLAALDMALEQRRPKAVIHHSDQGSQYTAVDFGNRCTSAGVRPSMGSVGDCFDNALCESFFATLECELLDRRKFKTPSEARLAVFEFIEGWYNPWRRHSALGYLSPAAFERRALEQNPQKVVENAPSSPGPPSPRPAACRVMEGCRPRPTPGTLPQPLENASRFPQPAGPAATQRESAKKTSGRKY
jgi:putative transposase